ncbi:TPA: hypothetical protein DCE37_19455 [Candidatus Latescibacteria bacterium]|nr:hypothetical protein [Candidatus Latescibacterota bacterium]
MNNTAAGSPLGVVLIQPDLSLAAPPVGVSAAFRGVDTDVTVEITNSGDGATAQTFEVVVYISEDPVAGNEDDIRVDDVVITTELEVGETLTVVVSSRILHVQATCIYHRSLPGWSRWGWFRNPEILVVGRGTWARLRLEPSVAFTISWAFLRRQSRRLRSATRTTAEPQQRSMSRLKFA